MELLDMLKILKQKQEILNNINIKLKDDIEDNMGILLNYIGDEFTDFLDISYTENKIWFKLDSNMFFFEAYPIFQNELIDLTKLYSNKNIEEINALNKVIQEKFEFIETCFVHSDSNLQFSSLKEIFEKFIKIKYNNNYVKL